MEPHKYRSVLKYPGSKWSIAEWIVNILPAHHTYVEPYFGSGAVFFNKKPSNIETINDIDSDVANLFKLLRDRPDELARVVNLTPYSRSEYDESFNSKAKDELEQARLFLIKCWQGQGFKTDKKSGWKNDIAGRERGYDVKYWNQLPEWLLNSATRLKSVQIENRPALDIIKKHNHSNVLIYADPTYLHSTRHGKQYKHEMTNADHEELLHALLVHRGTAIVSGYPNKMYDAALEGWSRKEISNFASQAKPRTEVIWFNFKEKDEQLMLEIP